MLREHRHGGFTLVEAVVIISVIGIMATIAAPRFLSLSELDWARAHRQTLSDLRFAQSRAAASGCPIQVDFAATSYRLRGRTNCRTGPFTREITDPVSNQTPFLVALPGGISITSSVDPLIFDSLGRSTSSAGVVGDATINIGSFGLVAAGETGLVRVP